MRACIGLNTGVAMVAGFLSLSCVATDLMIVHESKPLATVVVAAGASEQIRDAVSVLTVCIEEATGALLPVADGGAATAPGARICVGGSAATTAFADASAGLDGDGFAISFPDERTVFVGGPTDWGTEFGVYEFLERYVGVRWLLPGKDGTDIPKQTQIAISRVPVRSEPAFFSRLFSGLRGAVQGTWARRNRMHGRVSFHHNLIRLFPPETYTKTNPEFFPIKKGERFLPATNSTHGWQPCFTAPGITAEAIKNIVKVFDDSPETTSFSLGTNDSSGYCQCEQCLARISGEKNFLNRVDYSDLFYGWANQVIAGVLAKHPDKVFGCLAYSEVGAPPANVEVHERLIPYMTYDRMKWVDPELRKVGEELTKAWHAKSPTLGWYDYIYGTPYVVPRVWFHHMAEYYQFGHANGVRALYAEAYPNWGEGPKLYVALKLQWDPKRNVDALLNEWYERCVGPKGAPYLAKYYAFWEDFWTRRVLDSAWFSKGGQYLRFSDPGYLRDIELSEIDTCRGWLEQAIELAETDKQRARGGLLLGAFEYYEATAYAYKTGTNQVGAAISTDAQALAALAGIDNAVAAGQKRRELALEEFPKHPVLVHPISITRYSLMTGDSWSSGSLWSVYDIAARAQGPVRSRIRELAAGASSDLLRLQAQLMLKLFAGELVPLTKNASFEEGTGKAAKEWTWWVKFGTGSMQRSAEVAHSGEFSVLCDGMRRGGPVQALPITPGRYALVCFVYLPEGQETGGTAELSMTLRDEAGKNLPSTSSKIVPVPGRWTALAVAADVPAKIGDKEVRTVMPMLVVDGFKPGEKVYFDDLMLHRFED